jgi:predicted RNase H-like HicB family nuclease
MRRTSDGNTRRSRGGLSPGRPRPFNGESPHHFHSLRAIRLQRENRLSAEIAGNAVVPRPGVEQPQSMRVSWHRAGLARAPEAPIHMARPGIEPVSPGTHRNLRQLHLLYPCKMILNAVIERDLQTGLLVGSVPGVPGAHTQGETVEEVRQNLAEVIALLREEGALQPESEFIATTSLAVE